MTPPEIDIKFACADVPALEAKLKRIGFIQQTPRTHEYNTLYDFEDASLHSRGELLRIRRYGDAWTLTHKAKGVTGKHKSRAETETRVADGEALAHILGALGLKESFAYEKFRSEWTDGQGHVVIDETPIGNFGEIEGDEHWIDAIAAKLEISENNYITASYAGLFREWKILTGSSACNMTFRDAASST